MEIIISNASQRPIYEQITSQIKDQILSGILEERTQLPSIRSLANDLRISVITTKRAYADLESEGFIETVPGKGSFVAEGNFELMREEKLKRVERALEMAVVEARCLDLEHADLHDMLDQIMESDNDEQLTGN